EREGEGVACRKPPGAVRPHGWEELGSNIKEGGARPSRQPLEAPADESVAVHCIDVDRHAAAGLVAVDHAQGPGGVRRIGDRPDVLEVPSRVEEVGRHDHRRPVVDPLGEGLRRDGHAVGARDELDLALRPGQPLVADRGEVEVADQDFVATLWEGQARGKSGKGDRNRGGDRGRSRRRVEQATDSYAQPLQQRNPVRKPHRGPLSVPVSGVAIEGGPAAPGEGAERAGVEVDVAVQDRELVAEGLPVGHLRKRTSPPGTRKRVPTSPRGGEETKRGGDEINRRLPSAAAGWYSARTSVRRGSSWAMVSRPHKGTVKSYTGVSCTPRRSFCLLPGRAP